MSPTREQVRALVERMTPRGLPDPVHTHVVNAWVVEWWSLLNQGTDEHEVARVGPVTAGDGRRVVLVLTEVEVPQYDPAGAAGGDQEDTRG